MAKSAPSGCCGLWPHITQMVSIAAQPSQTNVWLHPSGFVRLGNTKPTPTSNLDVSGLYSV
jgi:hypothetical protein